MLHTQFCNLLLKLAQLQRLGCPGVFIWRSLGWTNTVLPGQSRTPFFLPSVGLLLAVWALGWGFEALASPGPAPLLSHRAS